MQERRAGIKKNQQRDRERETVCVRVCMHMCMQVRVCVNMQYTRG